jgi:hypothetical protein
MSSPKVSVIMPTYNHAPFVSEAIESVLVQQGVEFELLIADDGSQDDTAVIARKHQDPRIQVTAHPINRGACVVVNELIKTARGEYVALLNSDDAWAVPTKLADQVRLLDDNPHIGASFGRAMFMDRDGNPMPKGDVAFGHAFDQGNRGQSEWIRYFFEHGNCLCHPTMLIRKRCYDELGGYNNRLRQLPDFDMWVRLVKRFQIHISDDEWVKFRVLPGENASSPTVANGVRTMNEHLLIADTQLEDTPVELLAAAFADWLPPLPQIDDVVADILRVWPLIKMRSGPLRHAYMVAALPKLRRLLDSDAHRQVLAETFGMDDRAFHQLLTHEDCLTIDAPWNPSVAQAAQGHLQALQSQLAAQADRIRKLEKEVQRPLASLYFHRIKRQIKGQSI